MPLESRSPMIVMMSSTYVPIYNHFYAGQANSEKTRIFRGYPSLTPSFAGLVERRRSGHELLKSTFNAEKCWNLSWSISSHAMLALTRNNDIDLLRNTTTTSIHDVSEERCHLFQWYIWTRAVQLQQYIAYLLLQSDIVQITVKNAALLFLKKCSVRKTSH